MPRSYELLPYTHESLNAIADQLTERAEEIRTFAAEMVTREIPKILAPKAASIKGAMVGAKTFAEGVGDGIYNARLERGDFGGVKEESANGVHPKKRGRKPATSEK